MGIDIDRIDKFDVALIDTIDRFNFFHIDLSTHLGWVNRGGLDNFIVSNCKQQSTPKDWIRIENGKLFPARDVIFFMITTNPVIAIEDCLFYGAKINN